MWIFSSNCLWHCLAKKELRRYFNIKLLWYSLELLFKIFTLALHQLIICCIQIRTRRRFLLFEHMTVKFVYVIICSQRNVFWWSRTRRRWCTILLFSRPCVHILIKLFNYHLRLLFFNLNLHLILLYQIPFRRYWLDINWFLCLFYWLHSIFLKPFSKKQCNYNNKHNNKYCNNNPDYQTHLITQITIFINQFLYLCFFSLLVFFIRIIFIFLLLIHFYFIILFYIFL